MTFGCGKKTKKQRRLQSSSQKTMLRVTSWFSECCLQLKTILCFMFYVFFVCFSLKTAHKDDTYCNLSSSRKRGYKLSHTTQTNLNFKTHIKGVRNKVKFSLKNVWFVWDFLINETAKIYIFFIISLPNYILSDKLV